MGSIFSNSEENLPKFDENRKQILWIDQNVNNKENRQTLEYFKNEFKDGYNIITLESVSAAFKLLEILKKVFEFRLFYVIVSGRLAEEFFNNYAEKVIDMNILSATIIYCFNDSYHKTKNYYKDSFLNPGGIVSCPEEVVKYIKKVENNPMNIQINPKFNESDKESYGYIFDYAKDLSEIVLPLIISHFIKSYLISKKDLEEMENNFVSIFGKEILDYINPQKEKKINIPFHILAKFYIRLYTSENIRFYPRMNKDLSNKKFDLYRTYIFLLYNGIHKKTLKNYSSGKLYRGSSLLKSEYLSIKNYLEEKKKNKTNTTAVLYYLKNFASFSKEEKKADEFLKFNMLSNKGNKYLVNVKYIIDENTDTNFFVPNLDIENCSEIPQEKEVLFLPLSCFEIYDIEEKSDYSIIRLKYLTQYKKEMIKYIERLKAQEDIQSFFERIAKSKYAKDISEIIGIQAQDKIDTFIKRGNKNEIKQIILSISSIAFCTSFAAAGMMTLAGLLGVFALSGPFLVPLFVGGLGVGCVGCSVSQYLFGNLILKSNSLYSKYIPDKYRQEKIFPSFTWKNFGYFTKSFIIELIEDDINKKWQVINIPREKNEIKENTIINGETIIEYKGISYNASCALFILYGINKEKITLEELNNPKKMEELVKEIAFLEVY
jgi:hypothetical protein